MTYIIAAGGCALASVAAFVWAVTTVYRFERGQRRIARRLRAA